MTKKKHKIEKNVKAKVYVKLICGNCKKAFKEVLHYSIYNGEDDNAFVIYPCECEKSNP